MYNFRDTTDSEFDFEEDASRSRPVRLAIPPAAMPQASDELFVLGPESLEALGAPETIPAPYGGSRVVSFPPYTTAPPIGLGAPTIVTDLIDTHRPTGDTAVPVPEETSAIQAMALLASAESALPTYPSPPPIPEGSSEQSSIPPCPVISVMRMRALSDSSIPKEGTGG